CRDDRRRDERSTTSPSRPPAGGGRGRAEGAWDHGGPRRGRQDRPRSVADVPGTARKRPYRPTEGGSRASDDSREDRGASWSRRPQRSDDRGYRGERGQWRTTLAGAAMTVGVMTTVVAARAEGPARIAGAARTVH